MDETAGHRGGGGSGNGGVRKVIMVMVIIVSLGYLMMWFILPTSLYEYNWTPKLRAKLTSTFLGTQSTLILIFTSPVILIAVLGSVYAHLSKTARDYGGIRKKNRWLAKWRRPVLVKGPLGVVSSIELIFLIMFIALLIWSLSIYLHVGYTRITLQHGQKRWVEKWKVTAFRLGRTANICLAFLFYPVTRASTILPVFGLTSETSIKYHIWVGHTFMALATAHGLCYLLNWAVTGHLYKALRWRKIGVSNLAGEISLLAGLILWFATFPWIRRNMFEVFFYTHYLYIIFMLFFFLHVGISYSFHILPCFFLFVIDRYVRFLQSRQQDRLLFARTLSCGVLELNFVKSAKFSYNPTSIIFIKIPAISRLQWHPFSIISGSRLENDRLSVIIKVGGTWTRKLYDMVSTSSIDRLEASVEGPYGPVSNHYLRYETLVMISGGSGITPFFSIIRELLFASSTTEPKIPKIQLITVFKNASNLSMLSLLLPLSSTTFDLSKLDLLIKAYVTGEKHETQEHLRLPQTIWFKPTEIDLPISPGLGNNYYLWLGAIISSSFIGFLIFIAILTRYYIYPIDHNTDEVFSTSLKTILYLLILCACIVITSGFAIIWNKKRNAMETTSQSRDDNGDRELESLPYGSIFENTEVHYGERPNLKHLLFGTRDSNVGVLVCGPPSIRQEVASICGSGLAENLHFESLSFTW
ncbi:hypothetical protein RND81_02G125300 [Saponaria officinalis]|uniref:FAD-binding FR-type domain-containing protein n=1 Tax=Saponaria officinalis TaxID=3572 RepID=A0AAW1ML59_SAPOF